jgi:hypothetical protein
MRDLTPEPVETLFLNMSIFMLKFAVLIGAKMSYVWSVKLHQNFKCREENSFQMFPDYVVQIKSQRLAHVVGYSKFFKGPNFLHSTPTDLNIARESMN